MSFKFISSILKGAWFIEEQWANAHLPLVNAFLRGQVGAEVFGKKTDIITLPYLASSEGVITQIKTDAQPVSPSRNNLFDNAPENSIAVIKISGPITKYDGDCGEPGALQIATWINAASASSKIMGIILDIDSPGGEGGGATVLADTIKSISKPIIAWTADGGAFSAAYWAASQCTEIHLRRTTDQVGSIGGYTMVGDFSGAYELQGIKVKTVYAPQSIDKNKGTRDAFEKDDVSIIEKEMEFYVSSFINDVSSGRKNKLKSNEWNTGKTYYANEAKKIGLIDAISNFQQVVSRVAALAKQNSSQKSTNNMSTSKKYPQLAKAAKWEEGYETNEDGIFLNHEEAAAVETSLASNEQLTNELTTQKDANTTLQTSLTEVNSQLAEANTKIQTLTNDLSAEKANTQSWKTKAEEYGAEANNEGTVVHTNKDESVSETKEAEEHPFTTQARKAYNAGKASKAN